MSSSQDPPLRGDDHCGHSGGHGHDGDHAHDGDRANDGDHGHDYDYDHDSYRRSSHETVKEAMK